MVRFEFATNMHVELLRLLAQEIWAEHYIGIISEQQIEYMLKLMYSTPKIKQELADGVIWLVFFFKNTPVGYISYHLKDENTVFLSKIYLKKSCHGMGIGKRMMSLALDFMKKKNAQFLELTVNINNIKAIQFYENQGFKRIDSVKKDIGEGFFMDDFVYRFTI